MEHDDHFNGVCAESEKETVWGLISLETAACLKQKREYKTTTRSSMLSDQKLRGSHTQMGVQGMPMGCWFAVNSRKTRDEIFSELIKGGILYLSLQKGSRAREINTTKGDGEKKRKGRNEGERKIGKNRRRSRERTQTVGSLWLSY